VAGIVTPLLLLLLLLLLALLLLELPGLSLPCFGCCCCWSRSLQCCYEHPLQPKTRCPGPLIAASGNSHFLLVHMSKSNLAVGCLETLNQQIFWVVDTLEGTDWPRALTA
jgi:hypothetical protein